MTMTFLFGRVVPACSRLLEPKKALPAAIPAAARRNSRRLQDTCCPISRIELLLRTGAIFLRIYKLTYLRPLFVEIGQMLRAETLIDLELFLGADVCARVNVSLPHARVSVGDVGIQFARLHVL